MFCGVTFDEFGALTYRDSLYKIEGRKVELMYGVRELLSAVSSFGKRHHKGTKIYPMYFDSLMKEAQREQMQAELERSWEFGEKLKKSLQNERPK